MTDAKTIIRELEDSISDIHPSTDNSTLREARLAMCHALDFIKNVAITMKAVKVVRDRASRSALARSSDPATSKAAAELDMTKMEREVFEVINNCYRVSGCIQDDLLDAFPPEKSQSITPRVRKLIEKGYVYETGETRTGKSGRQQRVIRATGKEMP